MINNVELEQNILGCFLVNDLAFRESEGLIDEGDFFDPLHAEIYAVIRRRFNADELVSPVVLKTIFEGHAGLAELGGPAYLARLGGAATSVFAIRDYCKSLRAVTKRRELQGILKNAQLALETEATPDEIVGAIEASLIERDSDNENNVVSMLAAVTKAAETAQVAHATDGIVGVTSGLADVDRIVGGFQPGELILLGGRPSMGKTAVALSMSLDAARRGDGVVISSMEMTPDSLALRAISNEAAKSGKGMPYTDAKRGSMNEGQAEAFFRTAPAVADLPITILPSNMRDMGAIYSGVKKAKRLLEARGSELKLVVVDYLQLISPSKSAMGRTQQITEISIALKGLAMRLSVPVLALSQLSRALESRENKRPMLSDLRDSGQLEQDADTVIFCYRDEYYLEREKPSAQSPADELIAWQEAMDATRGRMELIIAKQRMGAVGTVNTGFNPATNFLWDAS